MNKVSLRTQAAALDLINRNAYKRYVRDCRSIIRFWNRRLLGILEIREDMTQSGNRLPKKPPDLRYAVVTSFDRMANRISKASAKIMKTWGVAATTRFDQHIIDGFRDSNVRLITSVAEESLTRIRDILDMGARVEDLAKRIKDELGATESRAELIARDQTTKLSGQLNKVRQTEAGVEEYVWSTSKDERVRKSHRELDGEKFRWDDPPEIEGERLHPGEDIQCRCVAVPVLTESL